jgi:hypothetical protein
MMAIYKEGEGSSLSLMKRGPGQEMMVQERAL